ncbi:MAG: excinuclease ABC subunit A, partial [Bacteroidales bacterium]|nr:excinuclease ABC subunit A [Bacteroidales bacterium]
MTNNTPEKCISIKGARVNNLQNIDITIPRNRFIVVTGLSGSGKSSLAFDTLYAEGQRRYVESLSSYARQFLGRINKPEVDFIRGIPPAIAIEQKVRTNNPRSTVGTSTEIYDYMELLFARIGRTFSPVSGKEVRRYQVQDVTAFIYALPPETWCVICAPIIPRMGRSIAKEAELLQQQGFSRMVKDTEIFRIDELLKQAPASLSGDWKLVVDRVQPDPDPQNRSRIADSIQTAFFEGQGACTLLIMEGKKTREEYFSSRFEADGIEFEEPTEHLFSFNNPLGACRHCEGHGKVIGISEELIIPDRSLSVYEGAVACWRSESMSNWRRNFILRANNVFPLHRPYNELTEEEKALLWNGSKTYGLKGINQFFKMLEENSYMIQYRVLLARYRGKTVCPECRGTRL